MTPISLKTDQQIDLMRQAGKIHQAALDEVCARCVPGAKLLELDSLAETIIRDHGATPTFKGYQGFPASLCTMINSEVVHGIPDHRSIQAGDLLSIDCGVTHQGMIADAARTVIVGGEETNPERAQFSRIVKQALQAGCQAAKTGNTLGDIGQAIQSIIESNGYALAKEYTGHGVGQNLHEEPAVFNFGKPGKGLRLQSGLTLAIEPIVTMGSPRNKTLSDGWTVVTLDGKDACQWEHCGVVTPKGLEIFA